jgi:hypothetical protein
MSSNTQKADSLSGIGYLSLAIQAASRLKTSNVMIPVEVANQLMAEFETARLGELAPLCTHGGIALNCVHCQEACEPDCECRTEKRPGHNPDPTFPKPLPPPNPPPIEWKGCTRKSAACEQGVCICRPIPATTLTPAEVSARVAHRRVTPVEQELQRIAAAYPQYPRVREIPAGERAALKDAGRNWHQGM